MARQSSGAIRLSRTEWLLDYGASDEPRYAISVVAQRSGVRTTTLRRYEEWGLLEPARSAGKRRLYSESDIDRVLRIRRLMDDLGVNLAGAAAVLHLRDQLIALQHEMQALRNGIDANSR